MPLFVDGWLQRDQSCAQVSAAAPAPAHLLSVRSLPASIAWYWSRGGEGI